MHIKQCSPPFAPVVVSSTVIDRVGSGLLHSGHAQAVVARVWVQLDLDSRVNVEDVARLKDVGLHAEHGRAHLLVRELDVEAASSLCWVLATRMRHIALTLLVNIHIASC